MQKLLAATGLRNPIIKSLGEGTIETGGTTIGKFIGNLIGGFFIFAFILAFIYLLTGGISWITGGGDKAKLTEARDHITQALVGLVIVGAGWAIFKLVGQFLGIEFPNLELPTMQ